VFTHQRRHGKNLKGAMEGTHEVSTPVIFAVLTSVAAFYPLLTIDGVMGKIMGVIPMVVIPCLLFSLVESLLILPAHLGHSKQEDRSKKPNLWQRFQGAISRGLKWWIEKIYSPCLERGLRWRYSTVALGLATLIITMGIVAGGWIQFFFFPSVEADYIAAELTMPQGTPVEVTSAVVAQLEESAERLRAEIKERTGRDLFRYVNCAIGEQPYAATQARGIDRAGGAPSASHLGEVAIELVPAEDRSMPSPDMANRWRELTGRIPDVVELTFNSSLFKTGDDINVQLTGAKISDLRAVSARLKDRLASYPGVEDISDSFREGKKEVKLKLKPEAEVMGLTLLNLARQVRQAFYGEEVQRIQRGRDDIRVMVRYPEEERKSLGDMEQMRIRTPDGSEVPFSEVAIVDPGRGFASIKRVDRRRAVNVTADVEAKNGGPTPGEIIEDLRLGVLPEILADYPGVYFSFEGQQAEQRDTISGLIRGFALALFIIYALLAVPLKSYLQPFLIMLAIPFGLVGAIWGHMIMGMNLTILSVFGLVALAGVVVNDSLVMVDFINRNRKIEGDLQKAVRMAGAVRFRPILLTSLTTFAGLLPLLLEKSMQAKFLVPMAVSLAFGVIFSTFISLMLIPAGYLILEDLRKLASFGKAPAKSSEPGTEEKPVVSSQASGTTK
jgi:multidrug efflux pump subunit AcrB